jgi:hypothetical protein
MAVANEQKGPKAPAGSEEKGLKAATVQLLHHWSSIAHHLYLKQDVPVPLPSVGPLAELLNVSVAACFRPLQLRRCLGLCDPDHPQHTHTPTRHTQQVTRAVCGDINALAAAGRVCAADVAAALDSKLVGLLGRLAAWLMGPGPQAALLLNSKQQESLWQCLLLTLANLLRVLQSDDARAPQHAPLVTRFRQQLVASGGWLRGVVVVVVVVGGGGGDGGGGSWHTAGGSWARKLVPASATVWRAGVRQQRSLLVQDTRVRACSGDCVCGLISVCVSRSVCVVHVCFARSAQHAGGGAPGGDQ